METNRSPPKPTPKRRKVNEEPVARWPTYPWPYYPWPPSAAAAAAAERNLPPASDDLPHHHPPPMMVPWWPYPWPPSADAAAQHPAPPTARSPPPPPGNSARRRRPPPPPRVATDNNAAGAAATDAVPACESSLDLKSKVPLLEQIGASGEDDLSSKKRNVLMGEIVRWNTQNDRKHEAKWGSSGHCSRMVKLPSRRVKRRDVEDDDEAKFGSFREAAKREGYIDDMLEGLARVYECDEDGAADMLVRYLALNRPGSVHKSAGLAAERMVERFDGTDNFRWNNMFVRMREYKSKIGNCLVPTGVKVGSDPELSQLSKWVTQQRAEKKSGTMPAKRVELLEGIGFSWAVSPHRRSNDHEKCNRAIAARLVYEDLSIRECLILAGYEEQWLDELYDRTGKHSWRTNYVVMKDRIKRYERQWEKGAHRKGSNKEKMIKLVDQLKGGVDTASIFGEKASMLPGFLTAGASRKEKGLPRDITSAGKRPTSTPDAGVVLGNEESIEEECQEDICQYGDDAQGSFSY